MTTTHATQLAVFSLWTGLDHPAIWKVDGLSGTSDNACDRLWRGEFISPDAIRTELPSCPECLALCHLAMVEHDRFREMEEPRRE